MHRGHATSTNQPDRKLKVDLVLTGAIASEVLILFLTAFVLWI